LTELGIDYVIRQVPVEREARTVLRTATGSDVVPVLRLENGSAIVGEDQIQAFLGEYFAESPSRQRLSDRRPRRRAGAISRRNASAWNCPQVKRFPPTPGTC
jgi:glutathione S-transferase